MENFSEKQVLELFSSDLFEKDYNKYLNNKKCIEFIHFIDNIQLNTKYFRLTTNNKIGRNKRFKNKNCSNDTLCLKEINSLLNKLTDKNLDNITNEIKKKLEGKDYLKDLIIKNILDKCIVHQNYIHFYIQILIDIYNINEIMITKIIDEIYLSINDKNIDETQSEYLQFCDKNKKLDLYIGYSLLITELEKSNIINNKIKPSIDVLIDILNNNSEDSERYKCTQCLYNILKSLFGDNELTEEYSLLINKLISGEKTPKIKFKFMDIIERK
jgi:hypothetical protein